MPLLYRLHQLLRPLRHQLLLPILPAINTDNPGSKSPSATLTPVPSSAPLSRIELTPDRPFEVLDRNNSTQIDLNIKGGSSPYTVDVIWGDGSTQSLPVSGDGKFSLTHTYAAPGKYQVRVNVKDVLGSVVSYFHSVVSTNAAAAPKSPARSASPTSNGSGIFNIGIKGRRTWAFVVTSWLVFFILGFLLGRRKRRMRDPVKGMLITTKTSVINKKKTLVVLVFVVLLGIVGIVFSKYASSPVVVTASKTTQVTDVKGVQTGFNLLSTSIFEVNVPNTFIQKTSSETPDKSILASYMLAENYKSGSGQIGITVGKTDSPSLEDIAFVKQRRLESTNYTQVSSDTITSLNALVFTRNDGTEAAVFIKNGNKYASIVVSGPSGLTEKHTAQVIELVKVWRWL